MMTLYSHENHSLKQSELLLENIDRLRTTPMEVDRVRRNLKLDMDDVVGYCKELILNPYCHISRQGKNWYCEIGNTRITVNAYSYTIITAHSIRNMSIKLETMIYASEDGTNSVFTLNPALQKQLDALAAQHPEVCQRKARGEAGGVTYQVKGATLAIQPVRVS